MSGALTSASREKQVVWRPYKAGLKKKKPVKRGSTVVELVRPQRREVEDDFVFFFFNYKSNYYL